ncbi:uncharacterized protein LOC125029557 [Penaeus chinensis]|uniref:uncharacterized protein LOC125029557 n=1 Tax=Penaeus chinensis TaxID=139456 RepID=UPI001FB83FE5|nr:uncharacterized protein LOC125029557 [Penaeus chinensis]
MAALTMAQDQFEADFREELFKKYQQCPKYLMPKNVYCNNIEEQKTASQNPSSKSRHEYYILQKCEGLQYGGIEKLIKSAKLGTIILTSQKKLLNYSSLIASYAKKRGSEIRLLGFCEARLGQVDLLDMQPLPQAQFKWIMVYQYQKMTCSPSLLTLQKTNFLLKIPSLHQHLQNQPPPISLHLLKIARPHQHLRHQPLPLSQHLLKTPNLHLLQNASVR